MKNPLLIILLFLGLSANTQVVGDYTILIVDGSNATINGNLNSELTAMGHTCTNAAAATLTAAYDYSPYDVIIFAFGSTTPPGMATITALNESCDLGIISARGSNAVNSALGLATTEFYDGADFTIIENTHFITSPFPLGVLDLGFTYKSNMTAGVAGTTNLGTVAGGNGSLVIHDTYKRAVCPWYGHWDGMPWNADAETLMDRIIAWVVAPCCDNTTSSISVSECTSYMVPSGDSTYTVSGIYNDTIPNVEGCDSIITIDLTITGNPVMDAISDTTVCEGFTVTLPAFTSDIAGTTYDWTNTTGTDIGFGLSGTGSIGTFTALNGTASDVVVTIEVAPTSGDGCPGATESFNITVEPAAVCQAGYEQLEWKLSAYPNPAEDQLRIEKSFDEQAPFVLRDATGRIVLQGELADYYSDLDVSRFESGNYILEVRTSAMVHQLRIVLQ